MKLSELIGSVGWAEVQASLLWSYPEVEPSIEDYRRVFVSLQGLKPVSSSVRLVVHETFREGLDKEPFTQVSGHNGTRNRDLEDLRHAAHSDDPGYADREADIALGFVPWEQWLGMDVDPQALEDYTPLRVVAHCLWEMTSYGLEQSQIRAVLDEIRRRAEKLDAMTEEERKKYLIPWEQAKQDLLGDKEPE